MENQKQQLKAIASSVLQANTVSEYFAIVAQNDKRVNEGLTRAKSLFSDEEIKTMCEYYCTCKCEYSYIKAILIKQERETFKF